MTSIFFEVLNTKAKNTSISKTKLFVGKKKVTERFLGLLLNLDKCGLIKIKGSSQYRKLPSIENPFF
jgi:hypothetical protein